MDRPSQTGARKLNVNVELKMQRKLIETQNETIVGLRVMLSEHKRLLDECRQDMRHVKTYLFPHRTDYRPG